MFKLYHSQNLRQNWKKSIAWLLWTEAPLTSPAMNCPNPLGNVIVAMMKMTMAGYMKRLWMEITQAENAATQ